jgi:hypothetical protein
MPSLYRFTAACVSIILCTGYATAAPPTITRVAPRGAERGKAVEVVVAGTNLTPNSQLLLPFKATAAVLPEAKPNPAQVRFQVTVDPSVPFGVYPARLATEEGVSGLFFFCVDSLPNIQEVEDNSSFDKAQKIEVPAIVNGECAGGDVDFFRFAAKKGQRLVIETESARLGSGIVPQLRLTDSKQRFLAAEDTQSVRGDCRLTLVAPADGDYVIEISDSRYKGAPPPFYRLKIADYDFPGEVFPLGGKRGDTVAFTLRGGSLDKEIKLERKLEDGFFNGAMPLALDGAIKPGALAPFVALGDLPERLHLRTDLKDSKPLDVQPPLTINGRLSGKGQTDRFQFAVQPGQRYRVAVHAESLGSYLDGVLRILDQAGKQLALVDDVDIPPVAPGQQPTKGHDPAVDFTVPANVSALILELSDQRKRGGLNFGYRLTIEPATTDFELRLPATEVNVPRGGTAVVNVTVVRRGFTGPIQLAVAAPPAGLTIQGGDIPANASAGLLTISSAADAMPPGPMAVRIEGKAMLDGKEVKRQAMHTLVLSREANPAAFVLNLNQVAVGRTEANLFAVQGPPALEVVKGFPVDVPVTLTRDMKTMNLAIEVSGSVAGQAAPGQPPAPGTFTFKPGSAAANAANATFNLAVGANAPEGRLSLVVQGKTKINNQDKVVIGPAVPLVIHRPFTVELSESTLKLMPGQMATIKGKISRQPVFKDAVQLKLDGLPAGVTLAKPLAPVAAGANEFTIELKVDAKFAVAMANLTLTCSAPIGGMPYAHPAQTITAQLAK